MSQEVLKTELVKVGQDSLQVVRSADHGWVAIKAVCEALGIDHSGQMQRLKAAPWATMGVIPTVGSDGRNREAICLRSDKVAMWLATIDTKRLRNEESRQKLVMWQCEAADVLDKWARGSAPSSSAKAQPLPEPRYTATIGDVTLGVPNREDLHQVVIWLRENPPKLPAARKPEPVAAKVATPAPQVEPQPHEVNRQTLYRFMSRAAAGKGWRARRDAWTRLYDTLRDAHGLDVRGDRYDDETLIQTMERNEMLDVAYWVAKQIFPEAVR